MRIDDSVLGPMVVIAAVFLLNQLLVPQRPHASDLPGFDSDETLTETRAKNLKVELPPFSPIEPAPPPSRGERIASYRETVAPLIASREFLKARSYLIEQAAQANAAGDTVRLGYVLALLGEVATESLDLGAAEIFLTESIDTFRLIGDGVGEAYATMQLGRMHIKSRQVARHAGRAYDLLLLARYQLHHFQYDAAQANVREVIRASLEIDRYGTAASALETLARIMTVTGQTHESERALLQAAELHAASGREQRALALIERLREQGTDPFMIDRSVDAVARSLEEFRADTAQVRQAADYRALYYQYRNAGNDRRAWEFRIRAADALANTSKRAMYYRQPDVMAILYNSNMAMTNARYLVSRASTLFAAEGEQSLADTAERLDAMIF